MVSHDETGRAGLMTGQRVLIMILVAIVLPILADMITLMVGPDQSRGMPSWNRNERPVDPV